MTRLVLWASLLAVSAFGADIDFTRLLDRVENRYNRAKTLQLHFEQTYSRGRGGRTESGELFLRKPGRMRWQYESPKGKLFISDGDSVYLYTPVNNRVEKTKVKESDDMRAPLGFLLGKLDFQRDFGTFIYRPDGDNILVTAKPKSDKAPYSEVTFTVTPSYEIRYLRVAGQDQSVMEFHFTHEKVNPQLSAGLFQFKPPADAEVVEPVE